MESAVNYFLLAVLKDSRQEVLTAVHGLSDEQAGKKPAPERWSALDCLEHISTVEDRFLGWIAHGTAQDPAPDDKREKSLLMMIMDRTTKVQAPEAVIPSGRFGSLAEAVAAFEAARERSLQIARARGAELYSIKVKHPRFGEMNGAELMHIMAGHGRRHAAQIQEVRSLLGF